MLFILRYIRPKYSETSFIRRSGDRRKTSHSGGCRDEVAEKRKKHSLARSYQTKFPFRNIVTVGQSNIMSYTHLCKALNCPGFILSEYGIRRVSHVVK